MNDAISRSAVLEEIDWAIDLAMDNEMHHAMCILGERFKELPALDVAPVVRCKDCSNTDPAVCLPDGMFYCNEWGSTTRGHWYCCRGEKKEEVEDHD